MSIEAMMWAYQQDLPMGPKFVLVTLGNFADENASCYPSHETLAQMTGQHRVTVARHIKTLRDLGLIKSEYRSRGDGKGRTSDRHVLNLSTNVAGRNVTNCNVAERNVTNSSDQCSDLSLPMLQTATGSERDPKENHQNTHDLVEAPRDDIERLCAHLADRIEEHGVKRPTIGKAWREPIRLMLDRDKYTEEQIRWLIDKAHDDDFWRSNILSPTKLRKQADRLKIIFGSKETAPARERDTGPTLRYPSGLTNEELYYVDYELPYEERQAWLDKREAELDAEWQAQQAAQQ